MLKTSKMDTLWILMDTLAKYPLASAYRKWILWILSLYTYNNKIKKETIQVSIPIFLGKSIQSIHSLSVDIVTKNGDCYRNMLKNSYAWRLLSKYPQVSTKVSIIITTGYIWRPA